MSIVDNKKRGIIVLVVFVLVASAVVFFALKSVNDSQVRKVKLDNGDEILLNQGGLPTENISTQPFDERYSILSEKEFAEAFPGQGDARGDVKIPGKAENLRHCYQMKTDGTGKPVGSFDEIYQWDTAVYKDAQASICPLQRNSGYQYKTADRGYMELSFYKGQPLRIRPGDVFKDIDYLKSFVNEKKVVLNESTVEGINAGRKFYTAQFEDIDGKGTGAYLSADNVDADYFIAVVEILAGRDYPLPENIGGGDGKADDAKAFADAKKEITFRDAAEKMVYDERKAQIGKSGEADFSIAAQYYRTPKEQDGKKYNVSCQYYVKGAGAETWYLFLEERDGGIVGTGEPLIVPA